MLYKLAHNLIKEIVRIAKFNSTIKNEKHIFIMNMLHSVNNLHLQVTELKILDHESNIRVFGVDRVETIFQYSLNQNSKIL